MNTETFYEWMERVYPSTVKGGMKWDTLKTVWDGAIASLDGYVVKNSTGSYTVHLKKEKEE